MRLPVPAGTLIAALLIAAAPSVPHGLRAAPGACMPTPRFLARASGPIDSLTAGAHGAVFALVGERRAPARYLPHDDALLVEQGSRSARAIALTVPPYLVAPGVVAVDGGARFLLLVDSSLRAIDAATGRTIVRWSLDQQALGWPAALAVAPDGGLFVAGQRADAWTAQVEALDPVADGRLRLAWHAPLGLTHAGLWLANAGQGLLAAYLPDAHDAAGTILLLDRASGILRRSYAVPAPPLAADSAADRLYVALGDTLRAFSLRSGRLVVSRSGAAPFAVDPARGLVAHADRAGIVLAEATTLRPLRRLAVSGVTALAFAADDGSLLVSAAARISRADLALCAVHKP